MTIIGPLLDFSANAGHQDPIQVQAMGTKTSWGLVSHLGSDRDPHEMRDWMRHLQGSPTRLEVQWRPGLISVRHRM